MIALYIDGVECPLKSTLSLPRYDAKRLCDVGAWREGDKIELRVGSTPEMSALFGEAAELYHIERFNEQYHAACLVTDGVTLFEGMATLLGVIRETSGVSYRVLLRNGGAEWAKQAALTRIAQSDIDYTATMDMQTIEASWSEPSPVRFLPLVRDKYTEEHEVDGYAAHNILTTNDYYPFLSVRDIIVAMLAKSGYTLRSDFIDSPFFEKLYMSGAYHTLRSDAAYASMGFKAYRTTSTTGAADPTGRVNVWLPEGWSNIGCMVDTVSPSAVDENGVQLSDAHAYGGSFTFDEGYPCFKPKREITAAFDYHIRYTTDYRIVSSSELRGFDRLRLNDSTYVHLRLANPYRDQRSNIVAGMSYTVMLFGNYDATKSYLIPDLGAITGDVVSLVAPNSVMGEVRLFWADAEATQYTLYEGDWAIYEGYVAPTGQRTVEFDVRTSFKSYSPSTPEKFDSIYFEGAESGQQITLHGGSYVVPVFGSRVGVGSTFGFADVAQLDFSVADLMVALQQMFNLRFYTHKPSKSLYVEPRDAFFTSDIVDWRARQVDDNMELGERVVDCPEDTKYGYAESDAATKRLQGDDEVGVWHYRVASYAAKEAVRSNLNPLFAPTLSIGGLLDAAPSAMLPIVGDRDAITAEDNISPRILLYEGLSELPEGEYWNSEGNMRRYPLAYFHGASATTTLCFEDRDGCRGLNRYHHDELRENAEREELRCKVCLSPVEYVALFDPESDGATLRSLFRLGVGGNASLFRLQSIERYDFDSHIAECVFYRTLND